MYKHAVGLNRDLRDDAQIEEEHGCRTGGGGRRRPTSSYPS
jgi:hypothetical protein